MRRAIGLIDGVRFVQASDDARRPRQSDDEERLMRGAVGPMLQRDGVEAVDVIGMNVGQKERVDLALIDPHQRKRLRRAIARIEHERVGAGDDGEARPGARAIRQRRSGAAERGVQAVGKVGAQ
jgi:hypothetical protein